MQTRKHGKPSAFEQVLGNFECARYVPDQLVFCNPALTILKPDKTDSPLRAGIFLDYYSGPSETFIGQCICVDLDDFKFNSLYNRTRPKHFKFLRRRTEVVRDPANAIKPVFPFKATVLESKLYD